MSAPAKFYGLELPIYPEDQRGLVRKDEFIAAARSGLPEFTRQVCIDFPEPVPSLKNILAIMEGEFHKICDFTETELVRFEWGLLPDIPDYHYLSSSDAVNRVIGVGYVLGATVEVIVPGCAGASIEDWELQKSKIEAGIVQYYGEGLIVPNETCLKDVHTEQFMCGAPYSRPSEVGFRFIDLDGLFVA